MSQKKIYLLLTDTGTFFTRMIKSYTKKPYNHASIALDPELLEVYSFGRKKARNPFIGGFVREDINSALFEHAKCAIYSLSLTDNQIQKIIHFIQDIEAQKEHYRYNLLGLFGVVFNKPIKRKNTFFCSQFVAVLKECNIIHFEKDLALIEPSDLYTYANFQFVYEGKLKDFPNNVRNESQNVPCPLIHMKCDSSFSSSHHLVFSSHPNLLYKEKCIC
ncbi:hypothetical protein [Calidifontibacillus oryziterrae]|uniref:hypothetical protein n=1 Tax=Calidifontibacillus oryziterrae TaxID=1191699 RepID=UPI0003672C6E|nr:hypothetical protein [Calidifontibacillus oryziterrae]